MLWARVFTLFTICFCISPWTETMISFWTALTSGTGTITYSHLMNCFGLTGILLHSCRILVYSSASCVSKPKALRASDMRSTKFLVRLILNEPVLSLDCCNAHWGVLSQTTLVTVRSQRVPTEP